MLTPLVLILVYLSCTFLLGVALGWLIWKFGVTNTEEADLSFWKQRLERARIERDHSHDKIQALEREKAILKKRLDSALAQ